MLLHPGPLDSALYESRIEVFLGGRKVDSAAVAGTMLHSARRHHVIGQDADLLFAGWCLGTESRTR